MFIDENEIISEKRRKIKIISALAIILIPAWLAYTIPQKLRNKNAKAMLEALESKTLHSKSNVQDMLSIAKPFISELYEKYNRHYFLFQGADCYWILLISNAKNNLVFAGGYFFSYDVTYGTDVYFNRISSSKKTMPIDLFIGPPSGYAYDPGFGIPYLGDRYDPFYAKNGSFFSLGCE